MALRPRLLFLLSFLAIALAANAAFFVMSASAVSTRGAGYTFDGEPLERAVTHVAIAFAYVGRMYVIGRGIESGTAREVALKLTETCRVAAEPLTATDLAHGRSPPWTHSFPSGRSLPATRACRSWSKRRMNFPLAAVRELVSSVRKDGKPVVRLSCADTGRSGSSPQTSIPSTNSRWNRGAPGRTCSGARRKHGALSRVRSSHCKFSAAKWLSSRPALLPAH
ncbi:MAG: hypothetical protein H0W90_06130 [Actinobacteria bacterium]|nr:hypothetical protein [Actinomycetota bacterium]